MNPIDLLNSPVANALGWTLLHALWQGFALVLPTAVVLHLLRSRSSILRYQIGVISLLIQLLTSVATFVAYYQPLQAHALVQTIGTINQPLPVRWQTLAQTLPWHQQTQQFLESHLSQFVFLYLIGLMVFGLRLAGGWLYLHRLSQTAVQPATRTLITLTEQLRVALSLRAVVQVRESARIAVPMVLGTLKPVLLVPVSLVAGLSLSEMEAVLAHELAHVKRHDYAVNLLQSVVEVLYFFHPALWWLSARVREEREHCCDDLAVQACGGNGRILAQALARVEELRTIYDSPTPALAMALASNRQLLLHRVRRMLGVSTRPVVSNGSLARLTVATLLLVSVSVYAVQQEQPKQPKPRATQPKATRRHTVDGNSEYGMADNKKVSYIIWKGQKLPASRIAALQRQLDRVMAGQLSLDTVKQPNRDILLTIIEKNNSFDTGMGALADGLGHIDYDNIVASALKSVPVNLTIPKVEIIDSIEVNGRWIPYQSGNDANLSDTSRLSAAQQQLETLTRKMQEVMTERQPIIDRLSKEITELTLKNSDWQKMTDQFTRQQSVLAKQQNELAKQQNVLAQKLAPLHTEIARLSLQKTLKADQLIKQKQLQSDLLEKQMTQLGSRMGELGSQMGSLGTQMQPLLEPQQQRLGILTDSISKLVEPVSELSEKIGELSSQIAEDASRQAEKAMQQAEAAMRSVENMHLGAPPVRSARAPRPPRPLRGTARPTPPVAPAPPYKAVEGVVVPAKPIAPVRPKVSVIPSTPKVAPAPKPTPVVAPVPPK